MEITLEIGKLIVSHTVITIESHNSERERQPQTGKNTLREREQGRGSLHLQLQSQWLQIQTKWEGGTQLVPTTHPRGILNVPTIQKWTCLLHVLIASCLLDIETLKFWNFEKSFHWQSIHWLKWKAWTIDWWSMQQLHSFNWYIVQNWGIFYWGIPSRGISSGSCEWNKVPFIAELCYADPVP